MQKLKHSEQQKWMEYWLRSLKDAEMADIRIEDYKVKNKVTNSIDRDFILIDKFNPQNDTLPIEVATQCRNILERRNESEADVLISPLLVCRKRGFSAFSPFWYKAHVGEKGNLSIPKDDIMPIIPRMYLDPIADNMSDEDFVIGDLDTAENAFEEMSGKEFENYGEYISYLTHIFIALIREDFSDSVFSEFSQRYIKERKNGYFEAYSHKIYPTTGIIVFPSEENKKNRAAVHIMELYEYLCPLSKYPGLLSRMISGVDISSPFLPMDKWITLNKVHLGQMKADYPLSFSQRRSLYTMLDQWRQPVHVINGPPGTGKTTLLQNIVADLVVKSAQKREPCIIWGSAATNQAVKNIIESFAKGDNGIRWLPINSSFHGGYCTYFPGSQVKEDELREINYVCFDYTNKKFTGTFSKLETPDFLSEAENYYLDRGRNYFDCPVSDIEDVVKRLQLEITMNVKTLYDVTSSASELIKLFNDDSTYWGNGVLLQSKAQKDLDQYYSEKNNLQIQLNSLKHQCDEYIAAKKLKESSLEMLRKNIDNRQSDIKNHLVEIADIQYTDAHIGLLRKLFCRKLHARNKSLIQHYLQEIERCKSEINDVRAKIGSLNSDLLKIKNSIAEVDASARENTAKQESLEEHIKTIKELQMEWDKWEHNTGKISKICDSIQELSLPFSDSCDFYDQLDKLRAKLFTCAIRYWEGRWLIETKNFINGKDDEKSVKNRFRRYAMLTPCFVSTFHSAPKHLRDWDPNKRTHQYPLEFIDYLIVDEAGQASPEISIALFALAKKAIVVGDIKQIEPVWNIPDSIDRANLEKCGIKPCGTDEFNGRRCSCGSLMKIAQAACAVKDDSIKEKGNILLEHRRCLPEIIKYCSDLAYNGQIIPMREDKEPLYPKMAFFDVQSPCTTKNGNQRYNQDESREICNWLKENKKIIEDEDGYGPVEDNVGILTPFRGQKQKLIKDLKDAGFDSSSFKIGTVHALQGAERPIILFSSVYTKNDSVCNKFFDQSVNMLNVAVSRAKDSFILFGDKRIFDDASTPSGKLFEIVKKHPLAINTKTSLTMNVGNTGPEYDVFISFSSKDQDTVNKISDFLKSEKHHLKVFMSRDDLQFNDAESFRVGLGRALQHSKLMLFILSNNFVRSPETRNEWNTGVDSLRLPKLLFQIDEVINWKADDDNVRFFVSATGNGGQAIQAYNSIDDMLPRLLKEIKGILK